MANLFRQVGIYSRAGQAYEPGGHRLADELPRGDRRPDPRGGISEAGAISSWTAAATSYSVHGLAMLPVLHLLLDVRLPARRRRDLGRSRPTLARLPCSARDRRPHDARRRGLQHQDGSSLRTPRRCPTAAPTTRAFAGEFAVILDYGMRRITGAREDVFFYVTLMNENYAQPTLPRAPRPTWSRGLYRWADVPGAGPPGHGAPARLGTILREAIAAAETAARRLVGSRARSERATSFSELA